MKPRGVGNQLHSPTWARQAPGAIADCSIAHTKERKHMAESQLTKLPAVQRGRAGSDLGNMLGVSKVGLLYYGVIADIRLRESHVPKGLTNRWSRENSDTRSMCILSPSTV